VANTNSDGVRRRVYICDVTLRDGEQACDVAFTTHEKVEAVKLIERLGVTQVQVGVCGSGDAVVRSVKEADSGATIELLATLQGGEWRRKVASSIAAGVDELHISLRTSDRQLAHLGTGRAETLALLNEAVDFIQSHGTPVMVGASFATEADPRFLEEVFSAAEGCGAMRVGVSDSVGIASPEVMSRLVGRVTQMTSLPILVHCHNDYGLAAACTLAALEAGATWCDGSLCGVGERAGNAALEQLVMAAENLYGWETGIASQLLYETAARIGVLGGRRVPLWQPVVGDQAFAQMVESHVTMALDEPALIEPFDPSTVGNRRSIRLGKGSGRNAVKHKLESTGLCKQVDEKTLDLLIADIWERSAQQKQVVDDEMLGDILRRELYVTDDTEVTAP
jgi:isopropylmalate/homocitrate/citramalate synthase